ncbi:MAG: class I SAM-dependent methyltransferase [Alphaproteobacteria bacterium]|nr:class I SAM-dependent methyltransferase [Alphaproteobacteria bacterium]
MRDGQVTNEAEEAAAFAAVPCLAALVETILRLLPFDVAAAVSILELGAGSGILATALLARFPHARLTVLEESAELRAAAARRLAKDAGRVEARDASFARDELPRPFDAAVSMLRLHAIDDIARRGVYRGIYGALVPGGHLFIADHARAPTPGVHALYARVAPMARPPRGLLLANELPWLANIGFRDVDIHYKNLDYAVYGGRRPVASDFNFRRADGEEPERR